MARRALQAIVGVVGAVAVVFGALSLLFGAALVPDGGEVSASVDSELRFYAAWYAGAGVLLLRSARRLDSEASMIRAVCAVFGIAGCARVLSIMVVGTPHPLFVALMVAELAIPLVVVPLQAAVARRT
jgi:hypothetical protein